VHHRAITVVEAVVRRRHEDVRREQRVAADVDSADGVPGPEVAALADLGAGADRDSGPVAHETVGDIRTVESLSMSSCSTVSKPSMPIAAAMCFQALTRRRLPLRWSGAAGPPVPICSTRVLTSRCRLDVIELVRLG